MATAAIDLRFPDQWFQSENGLHQNWMRDYDPTTGRYVQADPLGLVDGASVYGYALQSPLRYSDFWGLEADAIPGPDIDILGELIPRIGGRLLGGIMGGIFAPTPLGDGTVQESRGTQDPVSGLKPKDVGRDCEGNCNPCPAPIEWWVDGPGHGHKNKVKHKIVWNQDPKTCICYPDRPSRGLEGR